MYSRMLWDHFLLKACCCISYRNCLVSVILFSTKRHNDSKSLEVRNGSDFILLYQKWRNTVTALVTSTFFETSSFMGCPQQIFHHQRWNLNVDVFNAIHVRSSVWLNFLNNPFVEKRILSELLVWAVVAMIIFSCRWTTRQEFLVGLLRFIANLEESVFVKHSFNTPCNFSWGR